jgi:hypothetical protein
MIEWEYNVVEKWGQPFSSEDLNKYGGEGWELMTVIVAYETMRGLSTEADRYFVFKRPKKK